MNNYVIGKLEDSQITKIDSLVEEVMGLVVELIPIQHELNIAITENPSYTVHPFTRSQKPVNFGNGLFSEINEVIDSTDWKHWKAKTDGIDVENIKIEIVDIFHFIPSIVKRMLDLVNCSDLLIKLDIDLLGTVEKASLVSMCNDELTIPHHISLLAMLSSSAMKLDNVPYLITANLALQNSDIDTTEFRRDVSNLILLAITAVSLFNRLNAYTSDAIIDLDALDTSKAIADINKLYVLKNALNLFRKDNGYATGDYYKNWSIEDGDIQLEDNIVVQQLALELEVVNMDNLYKAMDVRYKQVVEYNKGK